jgi:hypothetical protein
MSTKRRAEYKSFTVKQDRQNTKNYGEIGVYIKQTVGKVKKQKKSNGKRSKLFISLPREQKNVSLHELETHCNNKQK